MGKHTSDSTSDIQTLMSFDSNTVWNKAFPDLKNVPKDFDSVRRVSEFIDHGQVIYQAYKRGDMPFSFLKGVIQKWGVDTLSCTPVTITTYIRGLIGKKRNTWYYILDEDGNGDLINDKPVKLKKVSGTLFSGKEHVITFQRFQDGQIQTSSTKIKVLDVQNNNGEFRSLNYRYLESRKGLFTYHNTSYTVLLSSRFLSGFNYKSEPQIFVKNNKNGITVGPFREGDYSIWILILFLLKM
ncbi:hypothetical protein [Xanthocytophaga agilis]|uniref:Uncharacterized protein n=1 Tax=Xanthocytophaga agilis TaxID=3048010 RepID=A0AAE3R100_9BACT|nr:hypothetical protein [Xanthocytophaga agilis]MDJ1499647.1 hypothetical protein [Xanthocytophaga agilis]